MHRVCDSPCVSFSSSNPTELTPCIPAGQTGSQPSAECCGKLKEQESCLCKYINKRLFPPYVSSANVQKVLAACGGKKMASEVLLELRKDSSTSRSTLPLLRKS
ncbi:hypothetical protein BRARA_H02907 [Brassica rapa]|uniref:Bifunctional inhibitor/plant lipid transfer protein/seed storage helical domain-containing protein n=1 Tax=Brassica campestris TaxID=3711 RepID=A0A397YFN9_BRACM|nr:hypothetical protein BRARA_H02907 [Brassica rapa]